MKIYWPIAVTILLAAFALASPGYSVPLSEMDLDWFREKPLETEWGPDPFVSKVPASVGGKAPAGLEESFLLTAVLLGSGPLCSTGPSSTWGTGSTVTASHGSQKGLFFSRVPREPRRSF